MNLRVEYVAKATFSFSLSAPLRLCARLLVRSASVVNRQGDTIIIIKISGTALAAGFQKPMFDQQHWWLAPFRFCHQSIEEIEPSVVEPVAPAEALEATPMKGGNAVP